MISRSLFAAGVLAASALALPPLTTVQDTLYKADGTRFSGTLTISWTSFEAIDRSAIAQQTTTVTVVDGNLWVQLVPTTTATPEAFYSVKYSSDGKIQFSETWAVPSSAQPLRVRDVRVASSAAASSDTSSTTVNESDVVGLISDLGARPLKGPGYAAGRVAVVNATGSLEGAVGSATDCVHVDGSSGPCGGVQPSFIDNDALTGLVDGANSTFTLSAVPSPVGSLALYRNGILLQAIQDYTLSNSTVQFTSGAVPQPGDTLLASYRMDNSGASGSSSTSGSYSAAQLFPNPEVVCHGTGSATSSTTLASLGTCVIPAGYLSAGDRLDIRFDLAHGNSAGGFSFELHWGATAVLHRDAAAADVLAAARVDAAIGEAGAQLSHQSWGAVLAFGAGVGSAADDLTSGLTLDIQGLVAQPGDTLTLKNYTVVRYP
ncbi:MAG TPA: hypothetical protein VMH28_05565 [Candidatus Acidoferrales bacterium]|nr:hypothetical protein [Candidatus Acidoferrales bacterium]